MIREKIFRLHRHKSSASSSSSSSSSAAATADASAQKFDFTFSNIQAIQVPKGWDKVTLSLISSESGKALRKTGKVAVKNGSCQWTETFAESVWISGSKEVEEYLFKFLLAAGSSKSSTLGEFTVNLAAFLSSSSPMLVSLPLKKCDYGTILQLEVKCLTPRTSLRGEKWRKMQESIENEDNDYISELSDSTSSASNNVGSSSRARELSSRETSFSASVSRYSFDSMDDSVGRQSFSSQSRQDSIESNDSGSYSVKSVRSLKKQASLQPNGASSKVFKQADDGVVQDFEAEGLMWEQNTRRLSVEVEKLRKELCDQNVELGRSRLECREFSQEIERLRLLLEEASVKRSDDDQSSAWSNVHKEELEDEMKFQKEENDNMSLQFRKTQESNIELISILQEMEQTIDEQKNELLKSQESRRALQGDILALEDKIIATEMEQDLKHRIVKEFAAECNHRLAAKEEKIMNLEDALSELRTSDSDETNDDLRSTEHLSELMEENVYLSQRVSGLEAQLRYLTDKSESSFSELHHSEARVRILECQITRLEEEMETQKIDMKHKLLEKEKQWEEAQEECTSLSKLNIMLQGTIESLIDEYNSLQSFDGEVREQKMKLQEKCLVLESAARKNLDSSDKDNKGELESKMKLSELERVRLAEQNSLMHMQLQKVQKMQDEVLALRVLVREMKSRNQLLDASFKSVNEDYEEVKREKECMVEKVSRMQRLVLEAEEITRRKILLEEKVLRLEGDMIARDALRLEDVEIKSEMNEIKIANSKLLMRVKHLEEIQSDSASDFRPNNRGLQLPVEVVDKHESHCTRCILLEAEVEEIRERYLQISLKYAEVESQREELVMKLKEVNT
ncbi:hypothetical protein ACS0TY_009412 [Phlomoides rotata]